MEGGKGGVEEGKHLECSHKVKTPEAHVCREVSEDLYVKRNKIVEMQTILQVNQRRMKDDRSVPSDTEQDLGKENREEHKSMRIT